MCRNKLLKEEAKYSLNYFICLFLGLEIELQNDLSVIQILSIIIIVISITFRVLYSFQRISWKIDISPIFFWLLTLARINSANNLKQESNSFLFYTLGFMNGQYNNTFSIQNENPIIYKGKICVQIIIFITCLSLTNQIKLGIIFVLIMLCIMVGLNEIFYRQALSEFDIQAKENKNNRLFNELSFQQILKIKPNLQMKNKFLSNIQEVVLQNPLLKMMNYLNRNKNNKMLQTLLSHPFGAILYSNAMITQLNFHLTLIKIILSYKTLLAIIHSVNSFRIITSHLQIFYQK